MNFNSDDPLADLLSDNSLDNDSFFDNPTGAAVKKLKSQEKAKGKMEDLFGIKEEVEPEAGFRATALRRQSPNRNVAKPSVPSTPRITTQNPTQSLDDGDDDDLGFDPRKPKVGATRTNLFDDLLGTAELKRSVASAPATGRSREDGAKPAVSRQSTDTTTENSTQLMRPKTSTGRRSSGQSTVVNTDPLGLFGTTTAARDKDNRPSSSGMSTPKSRRRTNTADWLGLSGPAEDSSVDKREERAKSPPMPAASAAQAAQVEILKLPDTDDGEFVVEVHDANRAHKTGIRDAPKGSTAQNIMLLNNMHLETANAYAALQQQETHLDVAAQMKQQERALLEMQRKQETLLQQQERQFDTLLQQQIQRQAQLEEHIKLQQQRINTHMQLMMTQPTLLTMSLPEMETHATGDKEAVALRNKTEHAAISEVYLEKVQLEADVKRLELEKLRLDELVVNLKTNYEREIEMIEESYRKQLKVSEEHCAAVDTRLRSDLEEQSHHYTQKLEVLEADKQKLKSEYESDMATYRQDYEDELKKLRKTQEEDLEMVKEEHRRMLENIRQSKMLEFAVVQENGSYLDVLRATSSNLEELSGGLQGLRDEMQQKIETMNRDRERKLEARERKLEDAERRLKITEETAEEEKRRLMELVGTLEVQLNKLSKDAAEEKWQLRQQMVSLEAEKAAFEKEKEYTREQFARDEKRIADLKEQQLAEVQKMKLEFQQDRAQLLVERSKIETERKLQPHMDYDKERLEVEASLKVAHDATHQADVERERFHKMKRQLEQHKRQLVDKENMLRAKEDELEQELSSFRLAERKSQEAQQKARQAEQNYQAKMQFLLQRTREMSEKEANLTQERVLLGQERIKLHNLKVKLVDRKCTLCRMSERNEEIAQIINVGGTTVGDRTATAAASEENYRHMLGDTNLVERMLDENIAESYRKMKTSTNANLADFWAESGLDDDSKEMALYNLDNEVNAAEAADYLNQAAAQK